MHQVSFLVTLLLLGSCLARPGNIADEIDELYSEIGSLSNDGNMESSQKQLNDWLEEMDDDDRMEFEGRIEEDMTLVDDPEIREIADKDYENVMGRIIAVNLAHWRKDQEKRTKELQNKREYHANVQEVIETTNEGNGFFFDQGDMIIDCELYEELHPGKSCKGGQSRKKRNAIRARKRLWTSRKIPYKIPYYMSHIKENLNKAIKVLEQKTCLEFVPYNGQKNYIYFANDKGCSSKVGKMYASAGGQKVSLGNGCNFVGTILHELLHALGFFHEQARDDRDRFVEVKWENILDGFSDQFDKYSYKTIDMVGKDYDFRSIMHYDRRAFTKNGLDTIIRIDRPNDNFGMPEKTLSRQDIVELNALYDCQTKTRNSWTQWSEFTPCDEDCKKERQRYCYHSGNIKACGGNVNDYGIETQIVHCGRHECPAKVDGNWGRWSDWTVCDAQCDDGKRTRFRKCDKPEPKHGGKYCAGDSKEEGVCTVRRCKLGYEDTDFDSKLLGMWTNVGDIQWSRKRDFTQTMQTGPSRDHTTGKGYYLYMESSAPAQAGNRAILRSPWLTAPRGGQCMKFFYTMYGKTMGSLFVTLQQSGQKETTVFHKAGDQGVHWIGAQANLDVPEGVKYQIKIIAQIGQPGYSDIAIDDVYIDPGPCSCQDDYVSCSKWKAAGACKTNVKFMSKHCARSCDTCECKDDNDNCPAWAAQPNGCLKNPVFMRASCQKSCKVCHAPTGAILPLVGQAGISGAPPMCKDSDERQCPIWKTMGECSKNPSFMSQKCALSCGSCVCKDNWSKCPEWASKEECINNKDWMLKNCHNSCHVCACGDNHVKCGLWAKLGECDKNLDFMLVHCKKSCNKC
ncbi:hypothetical protein ACROYT_G030520 [Oculina patagonica]